MEKGLKMRSVYFWKGTQSQESEKGCVKRSDKVILNTTKEPHIQINKFVMNQVMKRLFLYFLIFAQIIIINATTYIVDDDGPADFTTIQSAIDSASSGDTVFVKAGTYREVLIIDKNISLLGEGSDSTIILAEKNNVAVSILGDGIIKGFTITSEDSLKNDGILINVRYKIEIACNQIKKFKNGISIPDSPIWGSRYYLSHCTYDTCYIKIFGNIITNNKNGIYLDGNYLTGVTFEDTVTYDAVENWWGTVDELEIKKGIFDWEPRIVDFKNWLLEEVKNPIGAQYNGIHQNNIYGNSEWNIYVVHDPTGVKDKDLTSPSNFKLYQNHPNPFNSVTTIRYVLEHSGEVYLTIYNVLGQRIRTVSYDIRTIGVHETEWDGKNDEGKPVPSGVYFYILNVHSHSEQVSSQINRMLLLR